MKTLVLVFCLFASSAFAQAIPPAPQKCTTAVDQSNLMAYNGHPKNTAEYWCPLYDKDPEYFWKRMLGWMAGGEDVALSGAYAVPPSPWFSNGPVPSPVPVPVPQPVPSVDLTPILNAIQALDLRVINLASRVEVVNDQVQQTRNDVAQGRAENKTFFDSVRGEWKRILSYAGPIVGAIFLGKGLQ